MNKFLSFVAILILLVGSASAYSYCRDITNLVEKNGVAAVNEPVNHGKGIYLDTSAWVNKPHLNGIAVYNAACGQGGSIVPFELINPKNASNGSLDNFTLFFFANASAGQNATYSIQYSTTAVALSAFPSVLTVAESGGGYAFTSGAFQYTLDSTAENTLFNYYGFSYTNAALGGGYPATVILSDGNTVFGSGSANVACTYVYNGTLTKWLNCTNSGLPQAAMELHLYDNQPKVDFTFDLSKGSIENIDDAESYPIATMLRNWLSSTIDSVRAQQPSTYENYTHDQIYFTKNGTISLRFAGAPNESRAAIIINRQQGNGTANQYANSTWYGNFEPGNIQIGMGQNAAGSTTPPFGFDGRNDFRIEIGVPATYSDNDVDDLTDNYSRVFNSSIGTYAALGSEQIVTATVTMLNWATPSQNNLYVGTPTQASAYWNSSSTLDTWFLELDNGNGTLYNQTTHVHTGVTANWTNTSFTTNATIGSTIRWRIWANNTDSLWNATPLQTFTTLATPVAPQWNQAQQNDSHFGEPITVSAYWTTTNSNLTNWFLQLDNGNGTFYNQTEYTHTAGTTANYTNATFVTNSTLGITIRWRIWQNNTFDILNATPLTSFVTQDPVFPNYYPESIGVSETRAGYPAVFHTLWVNLNLTNWTMEIDFGNGVMANQTTRFHVPGTLVNWTNYSTTLNTSVNTTIRWRIWEHDGTGNLGVTPTQTFQTTDGYQPQWFSPSQSGTAVGQTVVLSAFWTDYSLATWVLQFDNGSGAFTNYSGVFASGWSNSTKVLNSTYNSTIRWRYWGTDSSGNTNATALQTFTTTDSIAPVYGATSPNSGTVLNLERTGTFTISVGWTDNTNLAQYIVESTFTTANATFVNETFSTSGDNVTITKTYSANRPEGTYTWRMWAVDVAGNKAVTPFYTLGLLQSNVKYIDLNSPLGSDVITGVKGTMQFLVAVADESINPANGNMQMGALVITLSFIGAMLLFAGGFFKTGKKLW